MCGVVGEELRLLLFVQLAWSVNLLYRGLSRWRVPGLWAKAFSDGVGTGGEVVHGRLFPFGGVIKKFTLTLHHSLLDLVVQVDVVVVRWRGGGWLLALFGWSETPPKRLVRWRVLGSGVSFARQGLVLAVKASTGIFLLLEDVVEELTLTLHHFW